MCEVATIGKLECTHASFIAGFQHMLGHFGIFMIKHRYHTRAAYLGHYGLFVESGHTVIAVRGRWHCLRPRIELPLH